MKAKLLPWIASASLLGLGMSAAGAPTPQPNEVDLSAALAGTSEIKRDWGDAPNSYGTLQSSSGARHVINPNILLGQLIDAEGDGQPSGTALLDDTTPPGAPNDEDGVAIVSPLIVGQPATLAVTVKLTGLNSAFLNGWIDYSRNGNWGQSGERVLTNRTVVNGVNTITFTVPQSAATGLTAARFRLSSTMLNAPTGEASDGEVEDYGIEIRAAPQGATLDYGDAPNTAPYSFPTLLSENGARHTTLALATNQPFVMLGTKVDLEADGQPSLGAGGDDANDTHAPAPANEDDEDGVTFTTPLNPGQQATVRVVVTSFAIEFRWLNAWIDFDGDGTWTQANEKIFSGLEVQSGINNLNFSVPANARAGTTYARFRLTGGNTRVPAISTIGFTGLMPIGEVEDLQVQIGSTESPTADFGDAPNDATHTYPVTLANNGARHQNPSGVFLGKLVDREADGLPSAAALGDDNNAAADDEDGINFLAQLVPGQNAKVDATVTLTGFQLAFLHAWVDFNRDGTWNQADEHIFIAKPVVAGVNHLDFDVPTTAAPGITFARFRITGGSALPGSEIPPTGSANDGEVEDYAVVVRPAPESNPCDGDHTGTDFWLTFPGNYAPDPTNSVNARLRIVGTNGVTGTVEVPGIAFTQAFTIGASGFAAVLLPDNAELGNANDVIENKGIHVTASANVAVYGINQVDYTSDGFLGYATATLGREYLVQSYGNVHSGIPELNGTQFAIVACESNTVVTVTPTASTTQRAAHVPYTLTLQRGQTYQLRCTDDAPADLSGTTIVATKPVAVFGGHRVANVQSEDVFFADHLVEQILPSTRGGLEFITAPLFSRRGDTFRFFATEDETEITIGTTAPLLRNRGEFVERVLSAATRVVATKPVLAQQYANSSDYDGAQDADPFMVTLAHTGQFLKSYRVVTAGSEFVTHHANVVIPSSAKGTLLLDGAASGATFTDVAGSSYAYAQIALAPGMHTFSAGASFGLILYGWNEYESYGWPGGLSFGDTTPPTINCPTEQLAITAAGLDGIPCITRVPDYRGRVTVTDNCQLLPDAVITQTPSPNSIIHVGLYTLTFETRDAHGNLGICTTPLEVRGTNAPFQINCPDDITVPCEDLSGARVFFSVTAGENCQTDVPVACTPPSGSLFAVGTTTVTCTATSPSNGQRLTCRFIVRVDCGITPNAPDIRISRLATDGTIDIDLEVDGVLERADDLGRAWREVPVDAPSAPGLQSNDDQTGLDSTVKRRHRIRPTGERGFFRIRRR